MALDVIRVVSGDTNPVITLQLHDEVTKQPYDLGATGESVVVMFRAAGTTDTLARIECTPLGDPSQGRVHFNFAGGVLDVPAGAYEGEVVLTQDPQDPDSPTQTVYDTLRFRVRERFTEP